MGCCIQSYMRNNGLLGHKHSPETLAKIKARAKLRGNNGIKFWLGKKMSDEHRKKLSDSHKKISSIKLSIANLPKNNCGEKHPMFGKHHTKKTKEKLRQAFLGEKSNLWQGGKSFEEYGFDWTKTLRKSIRERDNYICMICGRYQSNLDKKEFAVHHIDYNKKNCNPLNLITLCHSCHRKTNLNRNYWKKYFKKHER